MSKYETQPGEQIELRPVVQWFAREMEIKLRKNDHKEHWSNSTVFTLRERLSDELTELTDAIFDYNKGRTDCIDEAVDVANFAMMVADKLRNNL